MKNFLKYMLYGTIVWAVIWALFYFEVLLYILIFIAAWVFGIMVDQAIQDIKKKNLGE